MTDSITLHEGQDMGASPSGDRAVAASAVEPVPVSPVPASIPSATRTLTENLARYLAPDAFNGQRRSKRNSAAAHEARKLAMKQARAAIRFFGKPGNIPRLAQAIETRRAETGIGSVHESAVRQDAPEYSPDNTHD